MIERSLHVGYEIEMLLTASRGARIITMLLGLGIGIATGLRLPL